jgi:hypothetical protein
MDKKSCKKCKQLLPLTEFYKEIRSHSGYTARCKSCVKASANKSYLKNKDNISFKNKTSYCPIKERTKKLKRIYGLTPDEYKTMLANQGYSCLICKSKHSQHNSGKFVIDHCHATNQIRGLLCSKCNLGIGQFKDDPKILRVAASYLERFYDG